MIKKIRKFAKELAVQLVEKELKFEDYYNCLFHIFQ